MPSPADFGNTSDDTLMAPNEILATRGGSGIQKTITD